MRIIRSRAAAVAAVLGLLTLGCTNQLAKNGTGDVVLLMVAINGGSPLDSDVTDLARNGRGGPGRDMVEVVLAARSKNPLDNTAIYTRAVILERYEVRYFRSDGRNTEGVDVPFRFAGNITGSLDIGGTSSNLTLSVEVVRLAAKLEPPLLNLEGGGGAIVLTAQAEVTVYGRTIASGDVVKAVGYLPINFSDYAEAN